MQKGRAGTWEIRLSQSWLPPAGRSWSFHIHCWAIFHSVAVSCTLCYDTLTPLEVKYLVLLQSHIPKGLTRMGGDTIRGEVMTVRESICQRWTAAHYAHDATPDRTASENPPFATAFQLQLSCKLVTSFTQNEPHQKLCVDSSVFSIRSIICTKFALAFVKYSVILPCQVRIWKEIPYSWLP